MEAGFAASTFSSGTRAQEGRTAKARCELRSSRIWRSEGRRRARIELNAAESSPVLVKSDSEVPAYVQDLVDLLWKDLPKMFNYEHEPDWSIYTSDVMFKDPITKFKGVAPYKANIGMLKNSPLFNDGLLQIRDISAIERSTGKWSVVSQFTLGFVARPLPWKPRLLFTGTSEYCVGTDGLVYEHIDKWDSIENQSFLSVEALGNVLSMLKPGGASDIDRGDVMRVYRDFDVRRYTASELGEVVYSPVSDKGSKKSKGPAPGWYACKALAPGQDPESAAKALRTMSAAESVETLGEEAIMVTASKSTEIWTACKAQWGLE